MLIISWDETYLLRKRPQLSFRTPSYPSLHTCGTPEYIEVVGSGGGDHMWPAHTLDGNGKQKRSVRLCKYGTRPSSYTLPLDRLPLAFASLHPTGALLTRPHAGRAPPGRGKRTPREWSRRARGPGPPTRCRSCTACCSATAQEGKSKKKRTHFFESLGSNAGPNIGTVGSRV